MTGANDNLSGPWFPPLQFEEIEPEDFQLRWLWFWIIALKYIMYAFKDEAYVYSNTHI